MCFASCNCESVPDTGTVYGKTRRRNEKRARRLGNSAEVVEPPLRQFDQELLPFRDPSSVARPCSRHSGTHALPPYQPYTSLLTPARRRVRVSPSRGDGMLFEPQVWAALLTPCRPPGPLFPPTTSPFLRRLALVRKQLSPPEPHPPPPDQASCSHEWRASR